MRIGRDSLEEGEGEEKVDETPAAYLLPCRYLRIEPVTAWGPGANLSIWYIELNGIDQPEHMQPILHTYQQASIE
jgi:hypothetical protein